MFAVSLRQAASPLLALVHLSNSNKGARDSAFPRHVWCPSDASSRPSSSKRAQGMPDARAPAASCVKNKTHELVTTGTPQQSGIPRAMVLRFRSCSSRRSGFLVSVAGAMRSHRRLLDVSVETPEPHDFAVRPNAPRPAHSKRPSHPAPNVRDDRDTPLLKGCETARS
jgi:hypothetical protein